MSKNVRNLSNKRVVVVVVVVGEFGIRNCLLSRNSVIL
jgi:hypothetical protein